MQAYNNKDTRMHLSVHIDTEHRQILNKIPHGLQRRVILSYIEKLGKMLDEHGTEIIPVLIDPDIPLDSIMRVWQKINRKEPQTDATK